MGITSSLVVSLLGLFPERKSENKITTLLLFAGVAPVAPQRGTVGATWFCNKLTLELQLCSCKF